MTDVVPGPLVAAEPARAVEIPGPEAIYIVPRDEADATLAAALAELETQRAQLAETQRLIELARQPAPTLDRSVIERLGAATAQVEDDARAYAAHIRSEAERTASEMIARANGGVVRSLQPRGVAPVVAVAAPISAAPSSPPEVAFARTTGLLQLILWSIVIAAVLVVGLAWFA